MLFAHLTDCHVAVPGRRLFGAIDTGARLRMAVSFLKSLTLAPEAVFLTGDLVDRGESEEYQHLREILSDLDVPYYLVPGNHDNCDRLRAAFPDHDYLPASGDLNWIVDRSDVRFIGIDTTVKGQPGGEITSERAAWVRMALAQRTSAPAFLFMHHPPFLTGIEALDMVGCRGADRLALVVAQFRHVEGIFCGHHHQPFTTRWAGVTTIAGPATAQQMVAGFAPGAIPEWSLEPPACMLHRWQRGSGLVSRLAAVEPAAGPFPYGKNISSINAAA